MLPNIGPLDLGTNWSDYSEDPWRWASVEAISASVFYAIVAGLFAFFVRRWFDSILDKERKEREDLHSRISRFEKEHETVGKKIDDLKSAQLRYRLYLLARISDYSKELEFWRNTAQRIMLTGGMGRQEAEAFTAGVTTSLKTYGTRGIADEYDSIEKVARMLTNPEIKEAE
jgi:hypothetical protein